MFFLLYIYSNYMKIRNYNKTNVYAKKIAFLAV